MSATRQRRSRFAARPHHERFARWLRTELGPDRVAAMRQLSFFMIRPEALVRRIEAGILDHLGAHGLEVLDLESCTQTSPSHFESLYRYNVSDATEEGAPATWWLDGLTFLQGPILTLLVYAADSGSDVHDELVALKGPADPKLGRPGQIRHDFASENKSLALVHSGDDWLSSAREYLVFHDLARLRENLEAYARLRADPLARQRHQEALRAKMSLERATYCFDPELATDFVSVLVRVKLRLLKLIRIGDGSHGEAGQGPYLELVELAGRRGPKAERLRRYADLCQKEQGWLAAAAGASSPAGNLLRELADPTRYDLGLAQAVVRFLRSHEVLLTEWERIVLLTSMHYPRAGAAGS